MRYTHPTILKTNNAIAAIQHVGCPNPAKPPGPFLERAVFPNQLTDAAAYEADE